MALPPLWHRSEFGVSGAALGDSAAWLDTWTIGSVGFLAPVAAVAAAACISCNGVSAYDQDDLFVRHERGPEATALLRGSAGTS